MVYVLLLVFGLFMGGGAIICAIACLRDIIQEHNPRASRANMEMVQSRRAILDGIKDFVFHSQSPEELPFGTEECPICLHAWEQGQRLLVIPSCHHVYHSDCIRPIILQRPRCPVCRKNISLEDGAATDANEADVNV